MYEHISDDVRKYWNMTEQYMNEVLHFAPEVNTEMAMAHANALHNLRMIISTVNFEALERLPDGYDYEEELKMSGYYDEQ